MKYLLIICLFSLVSALNAQNSDEKKALELFTAGNFTAAAQEFGELLKDQPENQSWNYYLGVCYLNATGDKARAAVPFEKVTDKVNFPNTGYMLGRAYHYAYRFDEAIKLYEAFIKEAKGSAENMSDASVQIQYCINAKELMKYPANVSIENLGNAINTSYDEYFPFIPKNESFVIFNSRRGDQSAELPDGRFAANVYVSVEAGGKFQKPVFQESVNTYEFDEEVVGVASDGSQALFFMESVNGGGDLYLGEITNTKALKPVKLPRAINTKHQEIAACLSTEGDAIYFASDMPGGEGGVDLYVVRKLPNGDWSQPLNLGAGINTRFDEDFPNLSPDGKFLFFSSKGHSSMGGYDIFRAAWDPVKMRFSGVENLRFPINTPEDDMSFMLSGTGRYGYMSTVRKEGFGGLDIYRVTFNEVEPQLSLIIGNVTSDDDKEKFEEVLITVYDAQTDEIFGDYRPNRTNWRYVMILPPGNYKVEVYADNHEIQEYKLEVLDKASFRSQIQKDIQLKKIR
jgi:hypothetical protein